jgi:hypothetical protein
VLPYAAPSLVFAADQANTVSLRCRLWCGAQEASELMQPTCLHLAPAAAVIGLAAAVQPALAGSALRKIQRSQ